MSGQEKIIKTSKIENIENCSSHISKGSRSMYTSQFDMYLYIVNKVVNQDLKMTKNWTKFVQTSLTQDQRDDIDYVSRM